MLSILKKINTDVESTIVEISGAAIIAGSSLIFLARIGNVHPINFERITVHINVSETITATFNCLY